MGKDGRLCLACDGEGTWSFAGRAETCTGCRGAKRFAPPNEQAITLLIKSRTGKLLGRPQAKAPRAMYVWHLVRHLAGLPGGAKTEAAEAMWNHVILGDPYKAELYGMAERLAGQLKEKGAL